MTLTCKYNNCEVDIDLDRINIIAWTRSMFNFIIVVGEEHSNIPFPSFQVIFERRHVTNIDQIEAYFRITRGSPIAKEKISSVYSMPYDEFFNYISMFD